MRKFFIIHNNDGSEPALARWSKSGLAPAARSSNQGLGLSKHTPNCDYMEQILSSFALLCKHYSYASKAASNSESGDLLAHGSQPNECKHPPNANIYKLGLILIKRFIFCDKFAINILAYVHKVQFQVNSEIRQDN